MSRIYKNPPLIEALCEFRFQGDSNWDLTLPGLFYREVKEKFPKKREQNAVDVQFHGSQPETGIQGTMIPKVQFFSEDESCLVQLSPSLLTINHLYPYPNWDHFKALILEMLSTYSAIANPGPFARIGLRYINRIEQHEGNSVNNVLNYFPLLPHSLDQSPKNLLSRVEIEFDEHNGILILTLASIPGENPNTKLYLLDLDFVTADISDISVTNVHEWIEIAHEQIEKVFEASITDTFRQSFGEEEL